jgi:uncharacterized membrane protein YgcG
VKKSTQVHASWLFVVSASMVALGCGPDVVELRRCVDSNGFVLPDSYCQGYAPYQYNYGGHIIFGHPIFVYGGNGSLNPGGYVSGYSRIPTEGATIRSTSGRTIGTVSGGSISRGGFGGAGGSFGG